MIACPACGTATTVEETRGERRRRVCTKEDCKHKVTTIEVIVENMRRYEKTALMMRKDVETILRISGKALLSALGPKAMIELLQQAVFTEVPTDEVSSLVVKENHTPAVNRPLADADEAPDYNQTPADADEAPDHGGFGEALDTITTGTNDSLTADQLREVGIDPDNEEQLASLGLVVRKDDE